METDLWVSLILLFMAGGLTPGPSVMLVMASSLRYGMGYALVAGLGICLANVVWISLAASGAGLIAEQFPTAFLIIKIAGICFVLWLAWTTARQPVTASFEDDLTKVFGTKARKPPKYGRLAAQLFRGFGLQLSNPNALIWFGGLLPTFFDLDQPIIFQVCVMIATVTVTELLGLTVYASAARVLAHKFSNPVFARIFYVSAGAIMAISVLWAFLSQLI